MSPRTGRPRLEDPNNKRFSVCLNDEVSKKLDEYCEKHGISKGEAIRKALLLLLSSENEKPV